MNFSALIPCFGNHLIIVSDFRQLPFRYFLKCFPFFLHCCLLHPFFFASGIGVNLCTKLQWLNEFIPFAEMWSSWYLCGTPSSLFLIDSSASTIQAYLVLCFPILRQVSPRQFTGVLQSIAAGIGISNFLRAFFMVCLNSSSFGSMKKIPRNCLGLSGFGFSIAHFCFALLSRCIRQKLPHIWPDIVISWGCLFAQVSLRTMYIRQVAFRSIKWILWSLSMHLIISLSPSTF